MKERPILWSAPMVLALLAGRKTQTRRVVNPQPLMDSGPPDHWHDDDAKPYARVGDRLWGRETWRTWERPDDGFDGVEYRADESFHVIKPTREAADDWVEAHENGKHGRKWRPSIFMRRWMSRLLHEVTAVRVERLQDISNADAMAEGIIDRTVGGAARWSFTEPGERFYWPRDAYLAGWDTINGKGSAAKNPWVWAISFKPVTP